MSKITLDEMVELMQATETVFINASRKKWLPELDITQDLERLLKARSKVSWKVAEMARAVAVEIKQ